MNAYVFTQLPDGRACKLRAVPPCEGFADGAYSTNERGEIVARAVESLTGNAWVNTDLSGLVGVSQTVLIHNPAPVQRRRKRAKRKRAQRSAPVTRAINAAGLPE